MDTTDIKRIFFSLLFVVLLTTCGKESTKETPQEEHHEEVGDEVALTEAQLKTAGIALGPMEEKQISGTIKANGVLDVPPQQLVSISPPLGGFLKNTELLEGSRVKKGQVIAVIENLDFIQLQQDYLEAKSNFEFSKADYERQQELAKQNVNSAKTLQLSKSNYTNWQAKYHGLREKLKIVNLNISSVDEGNFKSAINLYAPIDGYVTQINANIGKFVGPSDVLFEIVDTDHLHAELIVFEKDVPKVKIGQKVRFTLANELKERMATVYLIGREISKDRTIRIHCHIDTEDKEFLPGMYLMAVVETGGAVVPALPSEAIVDFQGKKYIFIEQEKQQNEKNGTSPDQASSEEGRLFRMIEVQTGNSELDYSEILDAEGLGLKSSQVVIKGAYALLSKLKNSEEEGHAH